MIVLSSDKPVETMNGTKELVLLKPFLGKPGGFILKSGGETSIGQFSELYAGDQITLNCLWNRNVIPHPKGFQPLDEKWESGGTIEIPDWHIIERSADHIVIGGNDVELTLRTLNT